MNLKKYRASLENSNLAETTPVSNDLLWRQKYLEVLQETDRFQLSLLIRDTEELILARERELFTDSAAHYEKSALNNALHALRALRSCFGLDDVTGRRERISNSHMDA